MMIMMWIQRWWRICCCCCYGRVGRQRGVESFDRVPEQDVSSIEMKFVVVHGIETGVGCGMYVIVIKERPRQVVHVC
jgi:hypothetical protein